MLFPPKKTFIVDYESLADPRVTEFLAFGLVTGRLLLPDVAPRGENDHANRRAREAIDRLKNVKGLAVKLDRTLATRDAVIAALKKQKAMLITTSADLKTAAGPGNAVTVTDIYNLFKPQYLPGTELKLRVAKRGKEKTEGIGYLEGGIKVVVENGAAAVGSDMEVVIQGALDTDVGRVVFAKPRYTELR
jgi:uncharacterized protein YacL